MSPNSILVLLQDEGESIDHPHQANSNHNKHEGFKGLEGALMLIIEIKAGIFSVFGTKNVVSNKREEPE